MRRWRFAYDLDSVNQSPLASYLIEKIQEQTDWFPTVPDLRRTHDVASSRSAGCRHDRLGDAHPALPRVGPRGQRDRLAATSL